MIDSLSQWANVATAEILYKPDREKAFQELFDHMADSKDYYVEHGLSQPEASARAVAQMGDARETAHELAKMYHSVWYYVAKVTWVFVQISIVIMAFAGIVIFHDFYDGIKNTEDYRYMDPENSYLRNATVISLTSPQQSITQGGYTITAQEVMVYGLVDHLCTYVKLEITNQDPYLQYPQFADHLSLVDSSGTLYPTLEDGTDPKSPFHCCYNISRDTFSSTFILQSESFPLGERPVAIAYDRGGVTWTLPLEVSP